MRTGGGSHGGGPDPFDERRSTGGIMHMMEPERIELAMRTRFRMVASDGACYALDKTITGKFKKGDEARFVVTEIMRSLPFTKTQAVGNDFLVVEWAAIEQTGLGESDLPELARRMCERRTGVGADGLEVAYPPEGAADARIRIFNSDGSEAEISGNGTRCVAAWLLERLGERKELRIETAAGAKALRLVARREALFDLEMEMGQPAWDEAESELALRSGPSRVTLLDVGNPQCVAFVEQFPADWREIGAEIERNPRFPNRTNVSFVKVLDLHTIEVRFWERGAGETASSGTGSTGAAAAAILTGRAKSPVVVRTLAGQMLVRWNDGVVLTGPARLIASGVWYV